MMTQVERDIRKEEDKRFLENGSSNVRPIAPMPNTVDADFAKEADGIKVKHFAAIRRATAINATLVVIEQQGRTRFNSRDAQTSALIEKALHDLFAEAAEAPPEGTEKGATDAPHDSRVERATAVLEPVGSSAP